MHNPILNLQLIVDFVTCHRNNIWNCRYQHWYKRIESVEEWRI